MADLLESTFLAHECGLSNAQCLVVGVSGGPDSLALLHQLLALQPQFGWRIHVAHLDHGLRGLQSADEARFVAIQAAEWGLSATIELRDVGAIAREYHVGLPTAARATRYAFLAAVAFSQQADAVVVAHQANDQAETVVHHLIRGAGPSGLRGMSVRTDWREWQQTAGRSEPDGPALVRPLLYTPRSDIEAYCVEHNLGPRHDPTNDLQTYTRGRIRHQVLPLLESFNPQIVAALVRTARLASLEADFMAQSLAAAWPGLVTLQPGEVILHREPWLALHPALQRFAVRQIIDQLRPEREPLGSVQIDRALDAIHHNQIMHQLPHNLVLNRHPQGWIFLMGTTTHPRADEPQLLVETFDIQHEGTTIFPGGQWAITCELLSGRPEANLTRWQALLDADGINGQLHLCQRQPGDRIQPAGARGSRRVQDIMVDLRLPRELRPHWPLLADDDGLLWLPGLVVAERVHPGNDTRRFLVVTLEEIERHAS